jgi:hypothetical protein
MTTDTIPLNTATENSEAPCPYIQQGKDGKASCELAEVGLRVLTGKLKKAEQEAGDWKQEYEMFVKAWQRELGGKLIPKTHLIDALVLTTRDIREELEQLRKPIPMILHCPNCKTQHVDAPEPETGWNNPPHKSHKCRPQDGGCGTVWRPADVPTVGVKSINSRGDADTWQPINRDVEGQAK